RDHRAPADPVPPRRLTRRRSARPVRGWGERWGAGVSSPEMGARRGVGESARRIGAFPRRPGACPRRVRALPGRILTPRRVLAVLAVGVLAACTGLRTVETGPPGPVQPAPSPTGPPTPAPTSGSQSGDTSDATVPVTTAPGSPPVFVDDPNRPSQPYDEALSAAFLDIEAFWRTTFPQVYGGRYQELGGGTLPAYPPPPGLP